MENKRVNKIKDEISFRNTSLDCVNIHNNNIHSVTGYKPVFLIKNEDPDIYEDVTNNIKKNMRFPIKIKFYSIL